MSPDIEVILFPFELTDKKVSPASESLRFLKKHKSLNTAIEKLY